MKKTLKISVIFFSILLLLAILYLYGLPKLISNARFINFIEKMVKEKTNAELVIDAPKLDTSIKPEISFKINFLSLNKNGEPLLNLQNIDTKINFYKIFKKKITLEKTRSRRNIRRHK